MQPFRTFDEFYALYMTSHRNVWNRRVHLLGWLLGAGMGVAGLIDGRLAIACLCILLAPLPALAAIWLGHGLLEPTDDIEFKHPWLTARANLRMFGQMLSGRLER